MNDKRPEKQGPNQRVCSRINLARTLLLELDSGDILEGRTVDISPRGALMRTESPPGAALLGVAGTLFMISDEGHFSIGYPCKVVRLKGNSVALEIDKKAAAAFGNYMARDLLGRQEPGI
jgi:PilZ domain